MRIWPKILLIGPLALLMAGWGTAENLLAAPAAGEAAALQAVQQAPDPSAAVNAYANGYALDRQAPALYAAFVSRMVDLGVPEIAYHQAQTLTTMDPRNGLGWGVIAYVDARRADMVDAVSAINLAGELAPDNTFVQRTAGEIVAWYDVQANKSQLPESAKAGLAKIRSRLEKTTAFAQAYKTAKQAYQAQASATAAQPQAAPGTSSGYAAPLPYTPYYNNYYSSYYYGWGPGWVAPYPSWWWQPLGPWYGFNFFPPVVVFNNHEFFEHHGFFGHEHGFGHRGFAQPGRPFFHGHFPAATGQFGVSPGIRPELHRTAPSIAAPHAFAPAVRPMARAPATHFAPRSFGVAPRTAPAPHFAGRAFAPAPQGFRGFHGPAVGGFHGGFAGGGFHGRAMGGGFHGPAMGGGFHGPAMGGGFHGGFAGGGFHGGFAGGGFHGGFAGGGFHGGGFHGGGGHR